MMDRLWTTPCDESDCDAERDRRGGFTLPSRAAAIEAARPALRTRSGPLLVTGDAGVGKTWLCGRFRSEVPSSWRWITIDPSAGSDAAEFYRLVGHALGLTAARGLAASRLAVADFLRDRAADGDAWVLTVDEAHGLTDAVLEEIRILSNRLGQPDGFSGLVLAGQTILARRLTRRPLAGLSSRIAARVHLRNLDVEEAKTLLDRVNPDLGWDRAAIEHHHRDSAGNPGQLLRLARLRPAAAPTPRPAAVRPVAPVAPAPPVLDVEPAKRRASEPWEAPVLGPPKPPIRVEDGLIEVGWDPELIELADEVRAEPPAPEPVVEGEETIDDHYAALQAWNEWARNQGRGTPAGAVDAEADPIALDTLPETAVPLDVPAARSADVWVEGQQGFAPYSQLFSKLRQRNDTA